MTALQQHAVDDGVHADPTQVLVGGQLGLDTICWRDEQIFSAFTRALSDAATGNLFSVVGVICGAPPAGGDCRATACIQ